MNRKPDRAPEDVVERAMVAIRRRQHRRILAETQRRQGLPLPMVAVAELLDAVATDLSNGRRSTVTDLATQLRMDQPRVTRLVSGAVADGLLRRVADPADGRRSLLELTETGREVLTDISGHRRREFAGAMAGWTDGERVSFAELLTRFVAALDQQLPGPADRDR